MALTDDPAYLATLLQRTVPGAGPVISLNRIAEGFGAVTFRDASGLAIRIPHSVRLAERQYRTSSALRRLAPLLPAAIPVPLWMLPIGYPFATGAIGYLWINGEQPDIDTLPQSLIDQIGGFMATLHTIGGSTLDSFDGRVPGPYDVMCERHRVMQTALPWLQQRVNETVFQRITSWWDRFQENHTDHPYEPCIVHGDFWHGNLLVDASSSTLSGVIDWEMIALDDPAQDLATLLHGGTAFSDAVLHAYVEAGGHIDDATMARRDRLWQYREFTGLALAIEFGDEREALQSFDKLQSGVLGELFEEATP